MKEYDIGDEKMEQQAWIRKQNSNPPEIEIREKNGVTYLAVPASTLDYRHKLDEKLSYFTGQF